MAEISNYYEITHELIYQRFLVSNEHLRRYLTDLTVEQFLVLDLVSKKDKDDPVYAGRTYLNDLSETLRISIHKTSKIVASLRDRGLVTWSHDGDGADGTYVLITEQGTSLIKKQEKRFNDYYERVIKKYGQENMVKLLQMMKELETVMSSELEETEDITDE